MLLFHHRFIIIHILRQNLLMDIQLFIALVIQGLIAGHQLIIFILQLLILFLQIIIDKNNLLNLFFQLVHLILQLAVIFLLLFVQTVDERCAEVFGIAHHCGILELDLLAFALIRKPQIFQVFLVLFQLELEIIAVTLVHRLDFLF